MCIDHDPYQTQAPERRKVYMGTCCQTPVTPLGFKRLLDTVFYIPVAPLGLKSCGYHFFYTPIAPLGLKSCGCFRCYKHIVPTGLKRVSRTRKTTKLTPMVRLGNRTYRPENRTNPVHWVLVLLLFRCLLLQFSFLRSYYLRNNAFSRTLGKKRVG